MMKTLRTMVLTLFTAAVVALGYAYSGTFDVAADQPHTAFAQWLLQTTRERSIATRSNGIAAPPLDAPALIGQGANEYAEMCAGCHLAPGMEDTELRQGLNPAAPELAKREGTPPAQEFWIIKPGIKMTAMPAWGKTHDDTTIWSIVAFLQKLPTLTPQQYAEMTSNAEAAHEEHEHMHEHSE